MSRIDPDTLTAARQTPVFSAVDDETLSALVSRCRIRRFAGEEIVFLAGQPAEACYVIVEGEVAVFRHGPAGERQIVHLYASGQSVAEAAMFSGGGYPASAEATGPARLLEVPRGVLADALDGRPELAMAMLSGLSRKLRELVGLVESLSLKTVPARLAAELLEMADRAGAQEFGLPMSKARLAAKLGTAPETLSRALGKLQAAGWIEVSGARMGIRNRDALAGLAGSG